MPKARFQPGKALFGRKAKTRPGGPAPRRRFRFQLGGIALKLYLPLTLAVAAFGGLFILMNGIGLNQVVLKDQQNNLKAQSQFILTYIDKAAPGDWQVRGNELYKGKLDVSKDSSLVDLIGAKTGYRVSIFLDGTRVSTNETGPDGKRITGSKAAQKVSDKVLQGGGDYIGYADAGGKRLISFYTLITDEHGVSLGMLSLSSDPAAVNDVIGGTRGQMWSVTGIMLLFGIVFALLLAFYLSRKIGDALEMITQLSEGNLSVRLKTKSKDELGRMSRSMNGLAESLRENMLGAVSRIAAGDMSGTSRRLGERDEITPVLDRTTATVRSILAQTQELIGCASGGDLSRRMDAASFQGAWKELAESINVLMDSVSLPVEEVRGVLRSLSRNDFTHTVEGSYGGVFKDMAGDANALCRNLAQLQEVFGHIAEGDTGMLPQLEAAGRLSEQDGLTPAEIRMLAAIDGLIREAEAITQKVAAGDFAHAHGDEQAFGGGYRRIVAGFNETLDAFSGPMMQFSHVLEAMAVNDYTVPVPESYQGEFARFAGRLRGVQQRLTDIQGLALRISRGDIGALEAYRAAGKLCENDEFTPAFTRMMESIALLIEQTTEIAGSAADGDLTLRGRADDFEGGFKQIMETVNLLLDAVQAPIDDVAGRLVRLSDTGKFDIRVSGQYGGRFRELADAFNKTVASVQERIVQVNTAITQMAQGDFSLERMPDMPGDFQELTVAVNTILDTFNELMGGIALTSEEVAAGSTQVSQGSQSLSQSATEQASVVDELTATAAEIAEQTRENAGNAGRTSGLIEDVKTQADSGVSSAGELLRAMNDISASASGISKIVKLIDDIAFQTNVLALNAAVEAARAGQYGKGFAVVADEVRNLAAKSADAVKDTAALIEGTVDAAKNGTAVANRTAGAFRKIAEGVDEAAALMQRISADSSAQATGVAQIDLGLRQVSQVTQTVSATAEQSAAASEELSGQAGTLRQQIEGFRLRQENPEE